MKMLIINFKYYKEFILQVCVMLYTGYKVNNPFTDDWHHIYGPFLMGTVALGGIPLVSIG